MCCLLEFYVFFFFSLFLFFFFFFFFFFFYRVSLNRIFARGCKVARLKWSQRLNFPRYNLTGLLWYQNSDMPKQSASFRYRANKRESNFNQNVLLTVRTNVALSADWYWQKFRHIDSELLETTFFLDFVKDVLFACTRARARAHPQICADADYISLTGKLQKRSYA